MKRFARPFLVCALLLASSLAASAQMILRIDSMTTDELSLTILGGPGSALQGAPANDWFLQITTEESRANWLKMSASSVPISGVLTSRGASNFFYHASDQTYGDMIEIRAGSSPSFAAGEYFTADLHLTLTGVNAFDPEALYADSLQLYWGVGESYGFNTGALQSTAMVPEPVAVPEPSTYAAMAGAAALGFAAWRRRQRATAAVVANA